MYAKRHGLLDDRMALTIEQGVEMNRASRIEVALSGLPPYPPEHA
jgi:predicted PhzF superfamily epimerase YddE/YHI9